MMRIFFGVDSDSIDDVDLYFDNVFDPDWFKDPLVKAMVKDVDKSDVQSGYCIYSPFYGRNIPVEYISGGVKALILLLKDESNPRINMLAMGENCESWILKIAEMKDIYLSLSSPYFLFEGLSPPPWVSVKMMGVL